MWRYASIDAKNKNFEKVSALSGLVQEITEYPFNKSWLVYDKSHQL